MWVYLDFECGQTWCVWSLCVPDRVYFWREVSHTGDGFCCAFLIIPAQVRVIPKHALWRACAQKLPVQLGTGKELSDVSCDHTNYVLHCSRLITDPLWLPWHWDTLSLNCGRGSSSGGFIRDLSGTHSLYSRSWILSVGLFFWTVSKTAQTAHFFPFPSSHFPILTSPFVRSPLASVLAFTQMFYPKIYTLKYLY